MALNDDQRALVQDNMHIAEAFVQYRYHANPAVAGFTQDDLRQVGYLALCQAAQRYDGSVKFVTYAQKVLQSYLADLCREMLPAMELISLEAPLTDDSAYCLHDVLPDLRVSRSFQEIEARELLNRCKKRYTGVERRGVEAIELKMCGYTDAEIAQQFGRKRNQINAWIAKARKKLREDPAVISAMS